MGGPSSPAAMEAMKDPEVKLIIYIYIYIYNAYVFVSW